MSVSTINLTPIIQAHFVFNHMLTKLSLYDGRIRYCNEKVECTYIINFDFSFDIQKLDGGWVLSFSCPEKLSFFSIAQLQKWETHLSKIMRKQRFHDYYKGVKKLGRGNFASVYLTERISDNKIFAVKAFQKQATFKLSNGKQGLQNQINILKRLNHRNISSLLAVYESQNSIYLIMEFIQGKNLADMLEQNPKLSLTMRKKIIKGILHGLAQMQSKDIVHRDIKPENIMVNQEGEPKIIDFGLATDIKSQNYLFVRCGTPGFVAPQILNIVDVQTARMNPISDVFSAGAILYQMIFGKQLIKGQKNTQLVINNKNCDFKIPILTQQSSPQELKLLHKMLDVSPETRITASQALKQSYFQQQKRNALQQISHTSNNSLNHPNSNHLPPLKYPHNSHMEKIHRLQNCEN